MKTNNAEHTATPTITLDTSNNKQIEADITPPLKWAVTIPTTVNKTQLVIYIGNSAFDTQSSVDVKEAIGQLTHFITRACNAHDELLKAAKDFIEFNTHSAYNCTTCLDNEVCPEMEAINNLCRVTPKAEGGSE